MTNNWPFLGNDELVKVLITKKANMDVKDDDGMTPLGLALWKG